MNFRQKFCEIFFSKIFSEASQSFLKALLPKCNDSYSLVHYLNVEMNLPEEKKDQMRAVRGGIALCLLGGPQANQILEKAKTSFKPNSTFWGQVEPFYQWKKQPTPPPSKLNQKQSPSEEALAAYEKGVTSQRKGELAQAISQFSKAIQLAPNYKEALIGRGTCQDRNKNLPLAVADYSRVLKLDPNNVDILSRRGLARKAMSNYEAAISDFNEAISLSPNTSTLYYHLGLV